MSNKTNLGLVEYAKSKLKVPTIYMLGGFGRVLTQSQIDRRVNEVKCSHTIRNQKTIEAGIGKYCFDCVGIIKGYLWEKAPGNVLYNTPEGSDQNVGVMYKSTTAKGNLATMPNIPGLLVFTANMGHVGIYIGKNKDGIREYIEATPGLGIWGVGTSNDNIRKWAYWGKYHLIDYVTEQPSDVKPVEPKPIESKPVTPSAAIKVGDVVNLYGVRYATGQKIPTWVKLKKHTVAQVKEDRALLKEIMSWVYLKDIRKA